MLLRSVIANVKLEYYLIANDDARKLSESKYEDRKIS